MRVLAILLLLALVGYLESVSLDKSLQENSAKNYEDPHGCGEDGKWCGLFLIGRCCANSAYVCCPMYDPVPCSPYC